MRPGWPRTFLSTAGMIAVVTSVLAGAFVGVPLPAFFPFPRGITVGAGAVAFLASVVVLPRYQWKQWGHNSATLEVRFPSLPLP